MPTLDVRGDINTSTTYKIGDTTVLSSTALGNTVVNSSLTSVGPLTGLTVAGNISQVGGASVANLKALTVDSLSCAGNLTGTLTTPSQPYITTVGTLVSGVDIVSGQSYKIGGTTVLSSSTLGSTVTSSSLTTTGNLASLTVLGNISQVSGTANLQALSASSVACSGTISGTLSTPSQPNITSVGTLTGGVNIGSGQSYKIGGSAVLTATSLGSTVTSSNLSSLGNLTSLTVNGDITQTTGTTAVQNLTVGGQTNLKSLSEYMYNATSLISNSVLSTTWSSGSVLYATPQSSSNLTLAITGVPTTSTYATYSLTVILDVTTYKVFVSALTVNGSAVTVTFTDGSSSNVDVSTATVVIQTFLLIYTSSATTPWKCVSAVGGDSAASPMIGTLSSLAVSGDLTVDSGTLVVDSTNGMVGVCNTSPQEALDVTGNLKVSGALSLFGGLASLNSLTNEHVGYTYISGRSAALGTTALSSGTYQVNTTAIASVPRGVWQIDIRTTFSASSGTLTLTYFYVGINSGTTAALPTYSNSETGFRYDQKQNWSVSTTASLNPVHSYSQILRVDSPITNLYAVFSGSWTASTLYVTANSYLQITRLA